MNRICVDSGFLIGMYAESNGLHQKAMNRFAEYFDNTLNHLVVPWPILYETVSTQMVRTSNIRGMEEFRRHWLTLEKHRQLTFLDDTNFRQDALSECFSEVQKIPQHYRPLSFADRVIRKMLSDVNLKIDVFITFDVAHFQDICKYSRIQIIS